MTKNLALSQVLLSVIETMDEKGMVEGDQIIDLVVGLMKEN